MLTPSEVVLAQSDRVDPENLSGADFYVSGSPHEVWRRLRAEAPICRLMSRDGTEFWSVARHHDVMRVLRDTTNFTSEHGTMLSTSAAGDAASKQAINLIDGPGHAALRAPAMRTMTAAAALDRAPVVRRRLARLVDTWLELGTLDLSAALRIMPLLVAGDLVGLPPSTWPDVARWTMASVAPHDPAFASGGADQTLAQAHLELLTLFSELVRERRAEPSDDLISVLIGLGFTDPQTAVNCYAFVMGAAITTPQVIAHLALVAAEQPSLWRTVRDDRSVHNAAIEEALRWSSPINHLLRRAVQDVELMGTTIRKGERVCLWIASANRDEQVLDSPYSFRPDRAPNRHLAFGAGPHHCIGVHLARSGLRLLLAELTQRVAVFELAGPPVHLASTFVNGFTSLPLNLRSA